MFFSSLYKKSEASWGVAPLQAPPAVGVPKLSPWSTVVVEKNSVNELIFYLRMWVHVGSSAHTYRHAAADNIITILCELIVNYLPEL